MTSALRGLWGTATAAWAVGDGGVILAWNGSSWSKQVSGTSAQLTGVWGTSAQDVWAVGQSGVIAHYDGTSWTVSSAPLGPTGAVVSLTAVWGSAPRDVWAVGQVGTILH